MIRSQTIISALPLAEHLDVNKKIVSAKPNTILSELVSLSIPLYETNITTPEGLEGLAFSIEQGTEGSIDKPTQHTLVMDAITDDLSSMVTQHISIAKNDVKPVVVDYANAIQAYLESNNTKSPSDELNIITLFTSPLLKDATFLDGIKYYNDKPVFIPESTINLGLKTKEEVLSYMTIGTSRLDKLIMEWISSLDEGFVLRVWNSFFTTLSLEDVISYNDLEKKNAYDKSDIALGIYLIARKIYDDVLEVEGVDLKRYKVIIAEIRDHAGTLLSALIKLLDSFEATKMLVIETDSSSKYIKVNGDVYQAWLKQGGSTDVILGLLVSDKNIKSQAMIDSNSADLKSIWETYQSFYLTRESNNSFKYYKDFVYNLFMQSLDNKTSIEVDFSEKNPGHLDTVKKLFEEEFDKIKACDIKEVYKVSLCLIAKCRFYYTAGYEILNDINEAGLANSKISAREAALIAAINYMTDYLIGQISVSNA